MNMGQLSEANRALIEGRLLPGEILAAQASSLWAKLPALLDAARAEGSPTGESGEWVMVPHEVLAKVTPDCVLGCEGKCGQPYAGEELCCAIRRSRIALPHEVKP